MVAKCKECQNEVYVADRFRHCFTGYCYKCEAQREDSDFVIDDMGIGIGIVATIVYLKIKIILEEPNFQTWKETQLDLNQAAWN